MLVKGCPPNFRVTAEVGGSLSNLEEIVLEVDRFHVELKVAVSDEGVDLRGFSVERLRIA